MTEEGESFTPSMIVRGSLERLVPAVMTAVTAMLGLVPVALAAGQPGKEILYPVAVVILGGLVSSTLLDIVVYTSRVPSLRPSNHRGRARPRRRSPPMSLPSRTSRGVPSRSLPRSWPSGRRQGGTARAHEGHEGPETGPDDRPHPAPVGRRDPQRRHHDRGRLGAQAVERVLTVPGMVAPRPRRCSTSTRRSKA